MTFELTPQTIITAGAVITAAVLLIQRFAKGVRWFDQQEKQTTDIAALKAKHEAEQYTPNSANSGGPGLH